MYKYLWGVVLNNTSAWLVSFVWASVYSLLHVSGRAGWLTDSGSHPLLAAAVYLMIAVFVANINVWKILKILRVALIIYFAEWPKMQPKKIPNKESGNIYSGYTTNTWDLYLGLRGKTDPDQWNLRIWWTDLDTDLLMILNEKFGNWKEKNP